MNIKTNKPTDLWTDMVTLRDFDPILIILNTCGLFDAAMVYLYMPRIQDMLGCLLNRHIEADRRPIFRVTVCSDSLKKYGPTITFEVNQTALKRDKVLLITRLPLQSRLTSR